MKGKLMDLAIFVSTCDKYFDLIDIFIEQLNKNFSEVENYRIYINTESLKYSHPNLNIITLNSEKLDSLWSDRLLNSLIRVPEEYVLFFTEEYILESNVEMDAFNCAKDLMTQDKHAAAVHFVDLPGKKFDEYCQFFVKRKYDYRNLISLQVGIWRTTNLIKYIYHGESPWEFETLSSARGVKDNDNFYCLIQNKPHPFAYGMGMLIYRGYWTSDEVSRLKAKLNIEFDLSRRPMESIDGINKLFGRASSKFLYLRIKKYLILFKKIFNRFQ
jgi:hypothetical protein